ncbi:MAG TPA: hypothetical protein VF739_16940 [Ktedonobacterales bacterium]
MPESESVQATSQQEISLEAAEAQYKQSMRAYSTLLEKGTPWLFDVGSWFFGGLIAFTLLVMGTLITVGPVDLSIKTATVALALALPLDVTGLVLLRLGQDMKPVRFEQEISQTFEEVGLTPGLQQIPSLTAIEALRIRGTQIILRYALGMFGLSIVLTMTGMTAALWHMAWWIAVAFDAMAVVSIAVVVVAMTVSQPPVSAEERAQRRRYRDELIRQAKERAKLEKTRAKQANRR